MMKPAYKATTVIRITNASRRKRWAASCLLVGSSGVIGRSLSILSLSALSRTLRADVEHVSFPAHRADDRLFLGRAELLAQPGDLHVDRPRGHAPRIEPPHVGQ